MSTHSAMSEGPVPSRDYARQEPGVGPRRQGKAASGKKNADPVGSPAGRSTRVRAAGLRARCGVDCRIARERGGSGRHGAFEEECVFPVFEYRDPAPSRSAPGLDGGGEGPCRGRVEGAVGVIEALRPGTAPRRPDQIEVGRKSLESRTVEIFGVVVGEKGEAWIRGARRTMPAPWPRRPSETGRPDSVPPPCTRDRNTSLPRGGPRARHERRSPRDGPARSSTRLCAIVSSAGALEGRSFRPPGAFLRPCGRVAVRGGRAAAEAAWTVRDRPARCPGRGVGPGRRCVPAEPRRATRERRPRREHRRWCGKRPKHSRSGRPRACSLPSAPCRRRAPGSWSSPGDRPGRRPRRRAARFEGRRAIVLPPSPDTASGLPAFPESHRRSAGAREGRPRAARSAPAKIATRSPRAASATCRPLRNPGR